MTFVKGIAASLKTRTRFGLYEDIEEFIIRYLENRRYLLVSANVQCLYSIVACNSHLEYQETTANF